VAYYKPHYLNCIQGASKDAYEVTGEVAGEVMALL